MGVTTVGTSSKQPLGWLTGRSMAERSSEDPELQEKGQTSSWVSKHRLWLEPRIFISWLKAMQQEPCTHEHWVQLKPRKVSTAFTTYSCNWGDRTTYPPATAVSRDTCLSMGTAAGSKPSHSCEAEHSGKSVWLENSVCVLQRALAGHWARARTPVLMSWKTPWGPRQRHP